MKQGFETICIFTFTVFLRTDKLSYKLNPEYLASFIRVSIFRIDIKIDKKIYEIHNFIYLPILSIAVNALSSITANNIFTYLFRCWNSFYTRIQQHEMTQRNSFFLYLVFYLNLALQYYHLAIQRMLKISFDRSKQIIYSLYLSRSF